jgi:hypothetical protein
VFVMTALLTQRAAVAAAAYPASGRPFFESILFLFGCSVNMHLSWHLLLEVPPAEDALYVGVMVFYATFSYNQPFHRSCCPALVAFF